MSATNQAEQEATQEDYDRLHHIVAHLVRAAFAGDVRIVTTDRTGKVDAAWALPLNNEDGQPQQLPLRAWLQSANTPTRDFTLENLGGMLRMYAAHPRRNPMVSVRTYDDWPAMVEVNVLE